MGKEKDCCIGRCTLKFTVEFNCEEIISKGVPVVAGCKCPYVGFMTRTLTSRCKDIRCESKECDDVAYPVSATPECKDQLISTFGDPRRMGSGWVVRCVKLPCCTNPCGDRIKVEKFSISGTVVCAPDSDMVQEVMHDLRAEYGIGGTQPPTFKKCCVEPKVEEPNTKCWRCYRLEGGKPVCKQNVDRVKGKCPDGSYNAKDKCEKKMYKDCPGGDPK